MSHLPHGRTLLYYPTISVPSGSWLTRILLYWDQVGSIVPKGVREQPIGDDLRLLVDEDIYRPFHPEPFVSEPKFGDQRERLVREFLDVFHSEQFRKVLQQRYGKLSYDPFSEAATANHKRKLEVELHDAEAAERQAEVRLRRIHSPKLIPRIRRELDELDIQSENLRFVQPFVVDRKRDQDSQVTAPHDIVLVEETTAALYMALLAKYLAGVDEGWTTIGTDVDDYDSLVFDPAGPNAYQVMYVRLLRILPVPRPNVSVRDVVRFRGKHWSELVRFRAVLDECHTKLTKAEDPQEVRDILGDFAATIRQGTEELSAKLREAKISSFCSSLRTLIDLKSPALVGAGVVAAGVAQKVTEIPIEWTMSGLAFIGAIQVGTQLIDERNKRLAIARDSPFAYLYRAGTAGILRTDLW
jgi:uncharacterized protein DUF6236